MKPISLKNWIIAAVILIGLGILADYYFLHVLFTQKNQEMQQVQGFLERQDYEPVAPEGRDLTALAESGKNVPVGADNFLATLQSCLPEISSQGIATPEALVEYFKKSIGVKNEVKDIENYHMKLVDGSIRRIHVINTNNGKDNIQLYKVPSQGTPERVEMPANETLETLLSQGEVMQTESMENLTLKDDATLTLEIHNKTIFDLLYRGHGKQFRCHLTTCACN
ncbi:hypothetical protein D3C87_143840 [compost metagenome]